MATLSSTTSWADNDPLTPAVLNAKRDVLIANIEAVSNSGLRYFNVRDYGAAGDGSTDDRTAFQAAIDAADGAAANGVRGLVYVPYGTYVLENTLTWPAQASIVGQGEYGSILKFLPASTGLSLFNSTDASTGGDGLQYMAGLTLQLGSLVTNCSALNLTSSTPYTIIERVRFLRWTKYGINVNLGYGMKVERCTFNGISGNAGSGDIGTAIIAANQTNQIVIRGNEFLRCDRGVQLTNCRGVTIDGQNGFERLGYNYDTNGSEQTNTSIATAYGAVLNDIYGLTYSGNYHEGIKGIAVDLDSVRGAVVTGNYVAGEKSNATVTEIAFNIDDVRALTLTGNAVFESTKSWCYLSSMGTIPVVGLEQNYVEYGFASVNPKSKVSGYGLGDWRSAVSRTLASYTLTLHDAVVSFNSSSTLTATLPTASTVTGQIFEIRREGSQPVIVTATSGSSFNASASLSINTAYYGYRCQSMGTYYAATGLVP